MHTTLLLVFLGSSFLPASAQQIAAEKAEKTSPAFEVAAIKANKGDSGGHDVDMSADRLLVSNYTLKQLIRLAYDLKSDAQISGGPEWMDKQAFDISAKIDDAEMGKMQQMKRDERRRENSLLLQSLLAERFQLRTHEVQQVMPVYALVVVKSGPKLTASKSPGQGYHVSTHNSHMVASATSMDVFADQLTRMPESGERVVRNRTGLAGDYDFKLDWSPDFGSGAPADATDPGLFTALQEQLGLKLEPQKGAVNVVIVDSAAKPTLD
ncbi:MAG TPA: TIGR03435 family protein [Terracidiphilus sp.]